MVGRCKWKQIVSESWNSEIEEEEYTVRMKTNEMKGCVPLDFGL